MARASIVQGIGLLQQSDAERLRDTLIGGLATGRDPARVVAEVDGRLHAAAATARTLRIRTRWLSMGLTALAASAFITDRAFDRRFSANDSWFDPVLVIAATTGAIRFIDSFNDSPIERTARLWDHEPSLAAAPRFALVPAPGGAALALGGRF